MELAMRSMAFSRSMTILMTTLLSMPLAAGSLSGKFEYRVENGEMSVAFDAESSGSAGRGTLFFSTPLTLAGADEASPYGQAGVVDLSLVVELDCVVISERRASMSGIIRDSSVVGYQGRRMIFVVEDGGSERSDKFTWGVYEVQHVKWFPSDAERRYDEGTGAVWFATDAERQNEREIMMTGEARETDCRTFSLNAFGLRDVPVGSGEIRITP